MVRCVLEDRSPRVTYRKKHDGEDVGDCRTKNVQVEADAWTETKKSGSMTNQSVFIFSDAAHRPCKLRA